MVIPASMWPLEAINGYWNSTNFNSKNLSLLTQMIYQDIKTIVATLLSCFNIHNNLIIYYCFWKVTYDLLKMFIPWIEQIDFCLSIKRVNFTNNHEAVSEIHFKSFSGGRIICFTCEIWKTTSYLIQPVMNLILAILLNVGARLITAKKVPWWWTLKANLWIHQNLKIKLQGWFCH